MPRPRSHTACPTVGPAPERGLPSLAGFAARIEARSLPPRIVEKGKACLLYAMAVGVASMRAAQAAIAALDGAAAGRATRFFDGRRAAPAAAAFANGTLFHARVQDDAHAAGHVGVVVVPAALAMAEACEADGATLLAAIVAGYEVALRIGRDHVADASTRGFRSTPIYGVFGAAAAAGRLLGLDEARMTHALSLAANCAAGLREFSEAGSEDFPYQAGFAASNGITAAQLAAAGATSSASALDGKAGFFRAYGEAAGRYAARLARNLGGAFEIEAVTYKPYPICQFHRGVVRGSAALRARAGGKRLEALTIRMHPFEADFYGVRFKGPFASFPQTFMSAPFCAALGWARGAATYAGLTDFRAADVLGLVARVKVVADDGRARYAPLLQARLAGGRRLQWEERERANAYLLDWTSARDMTGALIDEAGLASGHAKRLIDAAANVEGAAGVTAVVRAMRAACRAAATTRTRG